MFEKFCHQHPNTFQKAKTQSLPNEPMAPGAIADRPGCSLRQICTEAPCQEEGHGRRGTLTQRRRSGLNGWQGNKIWDSPTQIPKNHIVEVNLRFINIWLPTTGLTVHLSKTTNCWSRCWKICLPLPTEVRAPPLSPLHQAFCCHF